MQIVEKSVSTRDKYYFLYTCIALSKIDQQSPNSSLICNSLIHVETFKSIGDNKVWKIHIPAICSLVKGPKL
jgi:hypothetical protein